LFLAFPEGSLTHSVIGEPLSFRGDLGALEFGFGSNITNLISSLRALVVTTEDNIQVVYGDDPTNWSKDFVSDKSIGVKGSGQFLARPLIVDSSGVIAIDRVESFGNFQDAIVSDTIRPIINRLANQITTSVVNRFRNHYIFFTETGENILVGFGNNQFIGYFPFDLDRTIIFASSNERRMLLTSREGGFVYEWGKGTSHDGQARILALQTSYAFQQSPERKKRYRRVTISLREFVTLNLTVAFSFGKGRADTRSSILNSDAIGGGGRWDLSLWDSFVWDGQDVPEIIGDIDGVGTDVSMVLYSESAEVSPYVIEDIIYEYSPRSIKR